MSARILHYGGLHVHSPSHSTVIGMDHLGAITRGLVNASLQQINNKHDLLRNQWSQPVQRPLVVHEENDWFFMPHADTYLNKKTGELMTIIEFNRMRALKKKEIEEKMKKGFFNTLDNPNLKQDAKQKGVSMFGQVQTDLKKFILEHKSTIYVVASLLLVDHFFFEGKFRHRLHDMMNKLLNKVEHKIDGTTSTNVSPIDTAKK